MQTEDGAKPPSWFNLFNTNCVSKCCLMVCDNPFLSHCYSTITEPVNHIIIPTHTARDATSDKAEAHPALRYGGMDEKGVVGARRKLCVARLDTPLQCSAAVCLVQLTLDCVFPRMI